MSTTFAGLEIKGSITRGETSVPQRPLSEFTPLLKDVLDDLPVRGVRWKQYTPYFNDGDPCVFHAYFTDVKMGDVEPLHPGDGEWHELEYGENSEELFGHMTYPNGRWDDQHNRIPGVYEGPDEERWNRLKALQAAIDGGEFNDVLLEHFGDHAEVSVVKGDAIHVEHYEHE